MARFGGDRVHGRDNEGRRSDAKEQPAHQSDRHPMTSPLPYTRAGYEERYRRLGTDGLDALLDAGRTWELSSNLTKGGSAIFPHAHPEDCGHQIAAVVQGIIDAGAERVIALGVLHGLSDDLREARQRVAQGNARESEPLYGIQGTSFPGADHWTREFSLVGFRALLRRECERRGVNGPAIEECYPFIVGDDPTELPGFDRLADLARDAIVVATMDPVHHGAGYGDEAPHGLGDPGLRYAGTSITQGLELFDAANWSEYRNHCDDVRSDGRDTGPVLRTLLGPTSSALLDLCLCDTSEVYGKPPTWCATALMSVERARRSAPDVEG